MPEPKPEQMRVARGMMEAWAADGSLPTWCGDGRDLQKSIARALAERDARIAELECALRLAWEQACKEPATNCPVCGCGHEGHRAECIIGATIHA